MSEHKVAQILNLSLAAGLAGLAWLAGLAGLPGQAGQSRQGWPGRDFIEHAGRAWRIYSFRMVGYVWNAYVSTTVTFLLYAQCQLRAFGRSL